MGVLLSCFGECDINSQVRVGVWCSRVRDEGQANVSWAFVVSEGG